MNSLCQSNYLLVVHIYVPIGFCSHTALSFSAALLETHIFCLKVFVSSVAMNIAVVLTITKGLNYDVRSYKQNKKQHQNRQLSSVANIVSYFAALQLRL